MTTQTADPRFDVIEQHPDNAETAFAYSLPTETAMRALAEELFGTISDDHQLLKTPDWSRLEAYYRLRSQFLGEAMPDDFEEIAQRPFPARA